MGNVGGPAIHCDLFVAGAVTVVDEATSPSPGQRPRTRSLVHYPKMKLWECAKRLNRR